jgi:hypothetical protein
VKDAARIKGASIIDAEVVCAEPDGVTDFDVLHSRIANHHAYIRWGRSAAQTVCGAQGSDCVKSCEARMPAFNMSNTPRAMVLKCSRLLQTWS